VSRRTAIGTAAAFLVVAVLVAAFVGAADLNPLATAAALVDKVAPFLHLPTSLDSLDKAVLFQIRLPRVVLGALVGGLLALAGAGYQGVFRNPLVDSGMLGASAGAGLGATLAIVYLGGAGPQAVPVAAFVGSLAGVAVAYVTGAAASAVAVSGLIGFVGIVIPHIARRLAGPAYTTVLPLSLLLGAGFLVLADTLARTVLSPAELPIGVVTAFVGAPAFVWVLRGTRHVGT
jgi:ABC-type Fe3+-siderophore transport system permease subunit